MLSISVRLKLTHWTGADILHLANMRLNVARVIFTGGAFPAFFTLSIASRHSSLERYQGRVVYGVSGKKKRVTKPTGTVMHWRHRLASHEWCSYIGPYSTNNIQPSPSCKSQMSIECLIYCCLLEHEISVSIISFNVCIHTRYPLKAVPRGAVIWKIAIRLAA
jgi:hypothetical protein